MKKILFILTLLTAFNCNLLAQNLTQEQIKQKINQKAAAVKTLQCDFVQTKYMKLLNKKQMSNGKMYYSQPDKLRWEYTSPYKYLFIINGNSVRIKNNNRNDQIDANRNKLFKEIAKIMMDSVVGKCLSDNRSFKTSIADKGNEWVATLLPQRREMKGLFKNIILHFNKSKAMVSTVELIEKNGDKTVIELKNVHLNEAISATTYN